MEPCSSDSRDSLYNAYCFTEKQGNIDQLYLGISTVARIEVTFLKCNSLTSTVPCMSSNDISAKLIASRYKTTYSVWSINPKNYTMPVHIESNDGWFDIPPTDTKRIQMGLMAVEFTSDDGWVTSSTKTKQMVSYESSQMDYITPGLK